MADVDEFSDVHPLARDEAAGVTTTVERPTPGEESTETPEQRDIRVAREKYGIDLTTGETVTDSERPAGPPPGGDDRPLSDDGDEVEAEVEDAEAVVEEVEGEVEAEEGDEALTIDDVLNLDDETLSDWLDAIGDDRILQHPRVRERVEAMIEAEARQRFEERQQQQAVTQETAQLIDAGRSAVRGVYDLVMSAQAELDKAQRSEPFDAALLADAPEKIRAHMGTYGAAIVAELRRGTETNFATAFRASVAISGPLSKQESGTVEQIIANARIIENAPEPIKVGNTTLGNGFDAAQRYLQVETARFNTYRAYEAGRQAALTDIDRRRDAAERITGSNAVTAAVAKVAAQRKGLPPRTPAAPAAPDDFVGNVSEYQAAKARGASPAELDAITDRMSRTAARGG